MKIAVLFARGDSVYKRLDQCDVWDIRRDARQFQGRMPVVAHPPCRAWGRLRHLAQPRHDEKDLAIWAVDQVRTWGGVLEHPEGSTLWEAAGLPRAGARPDHFGGYTVVVDQLAFGHRARKRTWLYIVGCPKDQIPPKPRIRKRPTHQIGGSFKRLGLPNLHRSAREHTPRPFAVWLCELASLCRHHVGDYTMATIGYSRVSTRDQETAAQLDALKAAGVKKVFQDVGSGRRLSRPGLDDAMNYLREGDTLLVYRLDRLARSLPDLLEIVKRLTDKGVHLRSMKEEIDTGTANGRLILHLFGALGEFEADLVRERTVMGLKAAAARGRVGGRPSKVSDTTLKKARLMIERDKMSMREAARKLRIDKTTLQRALKKGIVSDPDQVSLL